MGVNSKEIPALKQYLKKKKSLVVKQVLASGKISMFNSINKEQLLIPQWILIQQHKQRATSHTSMDSNSTT